MQIGLLRAQGIGLRAGARRFLWAPKETGRSIGESIEVYLEGHMLRNSHLSSSARSFRIEVKGSRVSSRRGFRARSLSHFPQVKMLHSGEGGLRTLSPQSWVWALPKGLLAWDLTFKVYCDAHQYHPRCNTAHNLLNKIGPYNTTPHKPYKKKIQFCLPASLLLHLFKTFYSGAFGSRLWIFEGPSYELELPVCFGRGSK